MLMKPMVLTGIPARTLMKSLGKFPSQWKFAHVVPVQKKGDKELISNYCPVLLFIVMLKVLEHCVFKRILSHVSFVFKDAQHGFTKRKSTATQLLCFLHEVGETQDKGTQTDVVYQIFLKHLTLLIMTCLSAHSSAMASTVVFSTGSPII